jgi:hypothetical protein
MKKAVGDKLWAAVVAVSEILARTRLIPVFFSLAFYTTFSHPSSYALRLFYLLDNDEKLPVLTQPLHHCMTRFT